MTALVGAAVLLRPLELTTRDLVTGTVVLYVGSWWAARPDPQASFLPLARTLVPGLGPLAAALVLATYAEISLSDLLGSALAVVSLLHVLIVSLTSLELPRWGRSDAVRVAVVGSAASAAALAAELTALDDRRYAIVGFVHPGEGSVGDLGPGHLGNQTSLAAIVSTHEIDLLLVSAEVPRLPLFDEIARSCLALPVRVMELATFYEETFGHVALAAINASWFQYLMHPRYLRATPAVKRALDLVVATVTLVVAAPVMLVLALVIRRDGGPAFYRQLRIGEGGRPFAILKLRSMHSTDEPEIRWSCEDDDRVTGVGRLMRRMHLDELPQLLNVLRGEMSIVGPRPEQPDVVKDLELTIPFYSRRHLVRPGITGWAQVQCGYAGSTHGSALKACYDLYYIKHRSLRLDLLLLLETLRTLVADAQWQETSHERAFALASVGELPQARLQTAGAHDR